MRSYSCCGISGELVEVAHNSERYVTMVLLPCPWGIYKIRSWATGEASVKLPFPHLMGVHCIG